MPHYSKLRVSTHMHITPDHMGNPSNGKNVLKPVHKLSRHNPHGMCTRAHTQHQGCPAH